MHAGPLVEGSLVKLPALPSRIRSSSRNSLAMRGDLHAARYTTKARPPGTGSFGTLFLDEVAAWTSVQPTAAGAAGWLLHARGVKIPASEHADHLPSQ